MIAGVWPLVSFRNAEFMNNEIPEIIIPTEILERMDRCTSADAGRAEGVAVARDIVHRIRSRVQGFQVSAPLGILKLALSVLDGVT